MECNHRINDARQAMEELENMVHGTKQGTETLSCHVPCDGCTLCCRGDTIRILHGDDASQYQTVPHDHFPGHLMLDHKPNGECVYLEMAGCSIQDRKPRMCREMDCRQLAKSLKKKDLKRYNVPLRIWVRGRRMLGKIV